MTIDEGAVEQKIQKGEELTADEVKFVMSYPSRESFVPEVTEDEDEFADIEDAETKETPAPKTDEKAVEKAPEKTEEKPAEQTGEQPAEKKTEEPDQMAKISKELEKADGQEDVTSWSDKERGMFYEMKRLRKRAQLAEEERDAERFKTIKAAKEREEQEKHKETAETETKELDELFSGDESEYISKGELKKLVGKLKQPIVSEARVAKDLEQRDWYIRNAQLMASDALDRKAASGEEIYDLRKVLDDFGPDVIEKNETHKKRLAEEIEKGGNAFLVAYEIITSDPKFPKGDPFYKKQGKTTKPQATKEAEKVNDKINANAAKPKTSAVHGGGVTEFTDKASGKTYTVSQLINMSPSEFRHVPKSIREQLLKQF